MSEQISAKCIAVIRSCRTPEQIRCAGRYTLFAMRAMSPAECFYFAISLLPILTCQASMVGMDISRGESEPAPEPTGSVLGPEVLL